MAGQMELMTTIVASNPGISAEDALKIYNELMMGIKDFNDKLKAGEAESLPEGVSGGQSPKGTK